MKEVCPHWSPARVALSWQVLDDDSDGKIGMTDCFVVVSGYMKDHELRRKTLPSPGDQSVGAQRGKLFSALWPVSRKPRKVFGPVKPFLDHLYLKTEMIIRLKLLV